VEGKMLKKRGKEVLRRGENVGVLNIRPLAMRSPLYSSSSSECEEGKQYHEKIQFMHSII
jgi:hypothetical protein